jgi:putative NADH-flavin reductase
MNLPFSDERLGLPCYSTDVSCAMRIVVLGATGRIGRALVAQALARGHTVTAFGRTVLPETHARLRVMVGNPMRVDDLSAALGDADAVLSALGTRGLGSTTVLVDGARAAIAAMQRAGVPRLVIISSSLVDPQSGWMPRLARWTPLRHTATDQRAMEAVVSASDRAWTIVRPARLANGALTRRYSASAASAGVPASSAWMSPPDVAHMMIDVLERGEYLKETVWLRGARG